MQEAVLDLDLVAAYVERGTEYLRRGDFDKAFADFGIALTKQPASASDVLMAVERRAAEMLKDDKEDPEKVCSLCRRCLLAVRPALMTAFEKSTGLAEPPSCAQNLPKTARAFYVQSPPRPAVAGATCMNRRGRPTPDLQTDPSPGVAIA